MRKFLCCLLLLPLLCGMTDDFYLDETDTSDLLMCIEDAQKNGSDDFSSCYKEAYDYSIEALNSAIFLANNTCQQQNDPVACSERLENKVDIWLHMLNTDIDKIKLHHSDVSEAKLDIYIYDYVAYRIRKFCNTLIETYGIELNDLN